MGESEVRRRAYSKNAEALLIFKGKDKLLSPIGPGVAGDQNSSLGLKGEVQAGLLLSQRLFSAWIVRVPVNLQGSGKDSFLRPGSLVANRHKLVFLSLSVLGIPSPVSQSTYLLMRFSAIQTKC